MRILPCFIDTPVIEARVDVRLRRYLLLRDATLKVADAEAISANVIVMGVDCDHFGPLLRGGRTIQADVVIDEDGHYFLTDGRRRQHEEDRFYARQVLLETERTLVAEAREQAQAALQRAVRA